MINARIHYLKLNRCYVDDVFSGKKQFEIRLNDRDYQVGDYIVFTPFPYSFYHNPIEDKTYVITYVLSCFGLAKGYVALGIECLDE